MDLVVTILVFVVLFIISGAFSGAEIALFSLSRGTVKKLQEKGHAGAIAVVTLKQSPHKLLVTILIGNNIANTYAAALATKLAVDIFGSYGVGIATGVVTFLILLFGEIFPKSLAQAYAEPIALTVSRPLLYLSYLLWPVVVALEWMSTTLVRLMPGKYQGTIEIEDEIRSLLHLGMEEGSTEAFERDYIERLFRFDDTAVAKVMIPYDKAVLADGEAEISQAARPLADSGYSRFPVFIGSRNNIVGMVHVKDLFRANNSERRDDEVQSVVRRAVVVKADDMLDDAFQVLRGSRAHSALVQDAADGHVVGFVTMEDILERLVGDIKDEFT